MTPDQVAEIRRMHVEEVYDDYQFGICRSCRACGRSSYFPCLPLKMVVALEDAQREVRELQRALERVRDRVDLFRDSVLEAMRRDGDD